MQKNFAKTLALTVALALSSPLALADGLKVGFVATDRIVREAPASIRAGKKIEAEFGPRDQELKRMAADLTTKRNFLTDKGMTLSDSERKAKESEVSDLTLAFQRRQREFQEDLKARQAESTTAILEKAQAAIERIAAEEKLDIVIQEAVWISQGVDITDRVLKRLSTDN